MPFAKVTLRDAVRAMLLLPAALFACPVTAAMAAEPGLTVNVDDGRVFQTMDGFGASLTDSSAWLIARSLTPDQRQSLLKSLFDPATGAGLSYLRQPMGSSDFRTREYTYDDLPAGQTDYRLAKFSIAKDQEYIIPILKQVLAIHPRLKIMATPWSAPAWMKDSGRLDGGRLKKEEAVYNTYADYFVRFLQAYAAQGIPIDAITLQNEPRHETRGYPTMGMEPADQSRLSRLIGERFRAAGIKTKIVIWDHNWDHPEFPTAVLNDADARPYIDGVAFHGYGGDVSAQSKVHDAFPDKNLYFTEVSGGDWSKDFGSNLMWDTANLIVGATRNWAKTVVKWNLALDEKNGPKLPGGADNCRGVVTIHQKTGEVTKEEEYYALGQAGKFVQPGARRIFTDNPVSVAFVNSDESLALIVYNRDREDQECRVRWRNRSFTTTLPGVSVVTFVWPGKVEGPVQAWMTRGDRSQLLERQPDERFQAE
jgi:glucosylceramidase